MQIRRWWNFFLNTDEARKSLLESGSGLFSLHKDAIAIYSKNHNFLEILTIDDYNREKVCQFCAINDIWHCIVF